MAGLISALLGTGLALAMSAQNPSWPARDVDLGPEALGRRALMPDDPEYAPRGAECTGQYALWSFTPTCAVALDDAERPLGVGARVDRAWLVTVGRPSVTGLLITAGGLDPADPELAPRLRLNPGELPPAQRPDGSTGIDLDGDGVFTIADFLGADGRVQDPRLTMRADRGDANGNGRLDPDDLARIFSDGRDDDGNGYVDDVVGVPAGTDAHASQLARGWVATANNGVGGAGICPRCTLIGIAVGAAPSGLDLARALRAGVAQGARVVLLDATPNALDAALRTALADAAAQGVFVVAHPGPRAGLVTAPLWDRVATAGSLRPGLARSGTASVGLAQARTVFAPELRQAFGVGTLVATPGDGSVLLAGAASLMRSATDEPLSPSTIGLILEQSATRLPGTDGRWSPAAGAGRLDVRGALDRLREAPPPEIHIRAPLPFALVDPTPGAPIEIEAVVRGAPSPATYTVELGEGTEVAPSSWTELARGEVSEEPVTHALSLTGLTRDPLAAPGPPGSRAFTIRVSVSVGDPGGRRPIAPRARSQAGRVFYVHRDPDLLPAFPLELGAPVATEARVLPDAEGDTIVLATQDGWVTRVDLQGRTRPGWPVDLGAGTTFERAPVVVRRSPLGEWLWAAVTTDGRLHVLDANGKPARGFPVTTGPRPQGLLVSEDPSSRALSLVVTAGRTLFVFGLDGAPRAGFPVALPASASAPATTGASFVFSLDKELWTASLLGEAQRVAALSAGELSAPLVVRVPGSARLRYVVARRRGVALVEFDGEVEDVGGFDPAPRAESSLGLVERFRLAGGSPALFDLQRGQGLTLVAGGVAEPGDRAVIGAWALDAGAQPPGLPEALRTAVPVRASGVDVDGDGRPEAVFADDEERLRALSPSGSLRGWPKLLGGPLAGAPQVAELRGVAVLVAVTERGRVLAYRLASPRRAAVSWLGPRHDERNTGNLEVDPYATRDSDPVATSCHSMPAGPSVWVVALIALGRRRLRRRP